MRLMVAACVLSLVTGSASLAHAGDGADPQSVDQQTCQQHQTNNTVAGAAVGAVVGGVVGNNVADSSHHGEGTALGAVVGGVAGGVIGHNMANCDTSAQSGTPEIIDTGKPDEPPSADDAPPADDPQK